MTRNWTKRTILTVIAACGLAGAGGISSAEAGGCYGCYQKEVVRYEQRREAYFRWVTVVDAYGCRRQVRKFYYRTITVPVTDFVTVCP